MSSGEPVGRRRLRDPAVADAARRVAARACPNRRSRSAGAAAAPDAAAGRPRSYFQRGPSCSRPLVGPRREDRVDRLVGDRAALANGTPSASNSPSTWPAPTPKISAPVRERVDGRERLGRLERVAVRSDVHVGHQPRGLRVAPRGSRASATGSNHVRRHRLGRLARDRDVVARRDVEEARLRRTPLRPRPCRRPCRRARSHVASTRGSRATGSAAGCRTRRHRRERSKPVDTRATRPIGARCTRAGRTPRRRGRRRSSCSRRTARCGCAASC